MSIFSTYNGKAVPVQIDLTYDLLEQYVTDMSMRNKRLLVQGSDGNWYHPYWLMPFAIHQVKDSDASYLLSHVLIHKNEKLKLLQYILSDLDTAFYKGFKRNIRNLKPLWCTIHMRKNDENEMSKKQKKQQLSEEVKEINRKVICNQIYGWKSSQLIQPGIVHLTSQEEILKALEKAKDDWNSRVPNFHEWFMTNRLKQIIANLDRKNIEDDGVAILSTNGCESMHSLEERLDYCQYSPGWSNKSAAARLRECIKRLHDVIQYQSQQEAEAIVNLGQYRLADEYKEFYVDLNEWCNFTEEEKKEHLKLFRAC